VSSASADDSAETLRLLAIAANGDSKALSALIQRHHAWLLTFAAARLDQRIRTRVDAFDVVQETQAEVCARLSNFLRRRPASFRAWMLKTAYDQLGKLKRRHIVADCRSVLHEVPFDDRSSRQLAEHLMAPQEGPWQQLSREELAARVQVALGRLDDLDREVLLLRYIEGLDVKEIGYLLEISAKTVRKRHGRALRHLHTELAECGIDTDEV
jgi:RNA polymerase sigma-70 factor (subfamily 1)